MVAAGRPCSPARVGLYAQYRSINRRDSCRGACRVVVVNGVLAECRFSRIVRSGDGAFDG